MSTLKVYGIGNILIDILVQVEDHDLDQLKLDKGIMKLVDEEERSSILRFIETKTVNYNCGGSAPNTIINLAALGIPVALSGKTGVDNFGKRYTTRLESLGVRSFLSEDSRYSTGSSIILVTPDSERTMNTSLCANRYYSVKDINPEVIKEADYLYFTGYMWDTDSQKEALAEAMKIARESDTKIVFDAADPFAVGRYRDDFVRLIKDHFHIVFANAEECRLLFGTETVREAAGILGELCDIAVVKDGRHGSHIVNGKEHHNIPVFPVPAVDTTGAGDVYAAGFLYGLSRNKPLQDCGLYASWLASRIVLERGAQFTETAQKLIVQQTLDGSWHSAHHQKEMKNNAQNPLKESI